MKTGSTLQEIAQNFPNQYIKFGQGIKRWKEDLLALPAPWTKKEVYYHYGPPGIGKSLKSVEVFGTDSFCKDCDTKWWDGYSGQDRIRLDDFPGEMSCITAKKWLGEANVPLENKGGCNQMRYSKVFITSNLAPDECFPNAKAEHRAAFQRRLTHVVKYSWSSAELTEESRALGYSSERIVTTIK